MGFAFIMNKYHYKYLQLSLQQLSSKLDEIFGVLFTKNYKNMLFNILFFIVIYGFFLVPLCKRTNVTFLFPIKIELLRENCYRNSKKFHCSKKSKNKAFRAHNSSGDDRPFPKNGILHLW